MSDSKSGDDKTLHVASKKTLTLKRGGNEQGVVRPCEQLRGPSAVRRR